MNLGFNFISDLFNVFVITYSQNAMYYIPSLSPSSIDIAFLTFSGLTFLFL